MVWCRIAFSEFCLLSWLVFIQNSILVCKSLVNILCRYLRLRLRLCTLIQKKRGEQIGNGWG